MVGVFKSGKKKMLALGGPHRTLAMACPAKKEAIKKIKEKREHQEKERSSKQYSEVIKETVKES